MPVSKKIILWNRLHAILISLVGVVLYFDGPAWCLSVGALISFAIYVLLHFDLMKTYTPFAGYANWLTATRLGVILCFGLFVNHYDHFTFFCISVLVIAADGLDGFLARKYNTASAFGAFFDMETDAFYVCMMSFLLYQENLLPAWILWAGWLRYGSVLVEMLLGVHGQPSPPNPYARFIAGLLFIALLLPWLVPKSVYLIPVGLALILVTFSFGYSFYLFFTKKTA